MIKLKKLSFADAKAKIAAYDHMTDVEFSDMIDHWTHYDIGQEFDSEYAEFRKELVNSFKDALTETGGKYTYTLDLRVGIKLYELLKPENGFNMVVANDDDIWRYISVCVMPDITYMRYPKPEQGAIRLNQKRFFSHTRRIWLKTLWWYIYLGWQGTADDTYEILKNNGTNIISHFIERPGKGYRPVLFRSMMKAYSSVPVQKDEVFRAAAKLNLAKCKTIEPALTLGGESVYSCQLFNEVAQSGGKQNDN